MPNLLSNRRYIIIHFMKKSTGKSRLRPTSSLVKQAVFNILGDIREKLFLDLFAGTGQIGMTALERGARVIFVEKNQKLAEIIKGKVGKNVYKMDALQFLIGMNEEADIIFADPPYDYKNYEKLIELSIKKLKPGGIFILEHRKDKNFGAHEVRRYGDTVLSIWRKEHDEGGLSGNF